MILTRDIGETVVEGLRQRLAHCPCMLDPGEDEFWTDDSDQGPWEYVGHYGTASDWSVQLVLELSPTSDLFGEDELFVSWRIEGRPGWIGEDVHATTEEYQSFVDAVRAVFGKVFPLSVPDTPIPEGIPVPAHSFLWWDIALTLKPSVGYRERAVLELASVRVPGGAMVSVEVEEGQLTEECNRQLDELVGRFCAVWEPFRKVLVEHFTGPPESLRLAEEDEYRRQALPPGVLYALPALIVPDAHAATKATRDMFMKGCNDMWHGEPNQATPENESDWTEWYGSEAVDAYRAGYEEGVAFPCLCCRQRSFREGDFTEGLAQCPACHQWSALFRDTRWDDIVEWNTALQEGIGDDLDLEMQFRLGSLPNPAPLPGVVEMFSAVYDVPARELVDGIDYDYGEVPVRGAFQGQKIIAVWQPSATLSSREVAGILDVSVGWVSTQAKRGGFEGAYREAPTRASYETGQWRIPIEGMREHLFRKHPRYTPPPRRMEMLSEKTKERGER